MARLIGEHDWSGSLGPIARWPASLKTTVSLMIHSPVPMVLLWGEDGVMIYNDAYSVFAGNRHPGLLGSKVRSGWPEVADFNDNVMRVGLAGGALAYKDQELTLYRTGQPEQVWMNLDYSPVMDESGRPGGVIAIVIETTDRVLSERRLAASTARQRRQFEQAPGFVIIMTGPEHVVEFVNETHRKVFGSDDWIGRTIREAFPSITGQGFFELLDRVFSSGEIVQADNIEVRYQRLSAGPVETRFLSFVYAPITHADGGVTGIFCNGFDITDSRRDHVRRDALARLSERLRDLEDVGEIAGAAAEILGQTLRVSRVGYGTIDADFDTLHVERDWSAPGVETLAGTTNLREYGSFIESLKRDEFIVIGDVRKDARTASASDALEGRSARSFVNAPVLERGRLVAVLYVNDAEIRAWTANELALIRDFAERCRTAMERARSRTALRDSEARLRFLDSLTNEAAKSKDANAILAVTTRILAERLGVAICAYADIDADEDGFTVRGDWSAPGSASIVGHYRLSDFGKLTVSKLGAGLPLVINDNLRELPRDEAAAFQRLGISATVCIPLVKGGRLTALMAVHDRLPRAWSAEELAILQEVTERSWAHVERAAAEAELRASEENFRTLARAMPNHVWTSPPDGQLNWFNEQVYAYSGAAPGSLDSAGWASLVHPDDLPDALVRWKTALTTGEPYQTEFRLRRADGSWRWHIARAVHITGEFGQILRWIGTNTDIQDQKESSEALADLNATLEQRVDERTRQLTQAQDALRQAQKMEAVGQLTGGIAHDFNNLLTGISGSLELLERRLGEGRLAGIQRYIDGAQGSARRAAALTQRLLAFSRRQTLDPKPTDLNKLVGGMEDLIRRSVGPNIELEVVGAGGLWPTHVDPSQLENSLLNLCINARDAMAPDGGRLTIETANKWLDDRAAKDRDLPPGQYVSLCVTDTGTGMTPQVIERAFDPFFTTKPLGQGTGLGLSMIYGFVRQSGGQVRIYSEVGKGTTMCLYLPRYAGAAGDEPSFERDPVHRGYGETVLVIDDETVVRTLIVDVLEDSGYGALEAVDGPTGLKILQSSRRIDLLITDVGLPGGMNGRQVADAARIARPGLKVLFITGYAENAVVGNGHLDTGMEIITKPFNTAALANKIRNLIDGT